MPGHFILVILDFGPFYHNTLRVSNGLGRPAQRSKAHGPAVGPQAGPAGRVWVKIKIVFSFEEKRI